jgi:small-conductance mechanosensitive channel
VGARLAAALLLATSAAAQEAGQPEAPEVEPEDAAIALVDVSRRAEVTARVLKQAADTAPPDEDIAAIERGLPEHSKMLAEETRSLSSMLRGGVNRRRLTDLSVEWKRALDELEGWTTKIAPRLQQVESVLEALSAEQKIWERTREEAKGQDAPGSVVKRIRTTLSEIDAVTATARDKRSRLLTLQDAIVQQDLLVTASLDQIRAKESQLRSVLLQRDAPLLWGELRNTDPSDHFDAVRASIKADLQNLRDYIPATGSLFLLDLAVFIIALHYARAVKRRLAHPAEGDPAVGRSGEMFERPVAIAILTTLIVANLAHDPAPVAFQIALALVLLVPLLRLIPLLLDPSARWVVWVMAALILMSRARMLVEAAPLAAQILFVLESIAAIGTLLWLMRPARLQALSASTQIPWPLRIGMRAMLVLLVTSVLVNALGYRAFASLVGESTLRSAHAAFLLYASVRVVEAALGVSLRTTPARNLTFIRRRRDAVSKALQFVVSATAAIYWAYMTLGWFEIQEFAIGALQTFVGLKVHVGALELSVGDAIAFLSTVALAFALARMARFFLEEEAFPRMRLRRGVGHAVSTLLQYTVLLIGFIFALSAAGMDFSRVALFAGAFSVGIGFGLQSVINNFVSGLILLFERPIQIGDIIEIGGLLGEVRRIGARSSTVHTVDGAEVIVPNANLISNQVVNWTLSDRKRRIDLELGVAYGTDPARVLELLVGVAESHTKVLSDPDPQALFLGFGDSALNFRLRVWIPRFEEGFEIRSELGVSIYAALRDAGIQIPFPQRDLHVRSVDAEVRGSLSDFPPTGPVPE